MSSLCGFVGAGLGRGGDEYPEVVAPRLVLEDVLDHGLPGDQVVALPDEMHNRIHVFGIFENWIKDALIFRRFGMSTCFLDRYFQTGSVGFRFRADAVMRFGCRSAAQMTEFVCRIYEEEWDDWKTENLQISADKKKS